jgi:hypothetical protein
MNLVLEEKIKNERSLKSDLSALHSLSKIYQYKQKLIYYIRSLVGKTLPPNIKDYLKHVFK